MYENPSLIVYGPAGIPPPDQYHGGKADKKSWLNIWPIHVILFLPVFTRTFHPLKLAASGLRQNVPLTEKFFYGGIDHERSIESH